MKYTSTNSKNVSRRMIKFVAHVLENPDPIAFEEIDRLLGALRDEDYFGTEGQCDPRGDGRG